MSEMNDIDVHPREVDQSISLHSRLPIQDSRIYDPGSRLSFPDSRIFYPEIRPSWREEGQAV